MYNNYLHNVVDEELGIFKLLDESRNLETALELIVKRSSGPQELKTLGDHPKTGEALILKDGRYGPYITDGKVNASMTSDFEVETITLEDAVKLVDKKRAAPPRKKKVKRKKKK